MRTIALEEHFWTDELAAAPGTGVLARANGAVLDGLLRDVGAARIADMDAAGIDVQVLSHVQPAAQGLRGADGVAAARRANDYLAAVIASSAGRLAGFATLPTGSPPEAAEELSRCVRSLGFAGGLINSTLGINGRFLDDPSFSVLLSRFEELDVPLYLHPAQPPAAVRSVFYDGLAAPVAGALATNAWGWHAEAGLHTLRLAAAGTFARHPGLRVIIGHCGEMIPFMLDRVDDMMPPVADRAGRGHVGVHPAARVGDDERDVQPAARAVRPVGVRGRPGAVLGGLPVQPQPAGAGVPRRAAALAGRPGEGRRRERGGAAAASVTGPRYSSSRSRRTGGEPWASMLSWAARSDRPRRRRSAARSATSV